MSPRLKNRALARAFAALLFFAASRPGSAAEPPAIINAALQNDTTAVLRLLKQGAEIDAKDNAGWTALIAAAVKGATPMALSMVGQ